MYQGVGIAGTSSGANTTGNIVAGNYVGTNTAGTAALPNTDAGVYLYGSARTTASESTVPTRMPLRRET